MQPSANMGRAGRIVSEDRITISEMEIRRPAGIEIARFEQAGQGEDAMGVEGGVGAVGQSFAEHRQDAD